MKKTLLSINNYFYKRGGAEAVFLEHNDLFQKEGWNIVPFSMRHERNLPSRWDEYFIEEIEFGQDYSLIQKMVRAPKIIYSLEARDKIRRLINHCHPMIAHAHNVYHHISPAIFGVLKKAGIPVVLTLHDLKIACPAYQMLAHDGVCERCKNGDIINVVRYRCIKDSLPLSFLIYIETRMHRMLGCYKNDVSRFVVPSNFYKHKLVEWGIDGGKLVHIPNFVDVDSFPINKDIGRAYVYFGRLGPEKGLETLIKAAAFSHTSLIIVGSGPEESRLRELAARTGSDVTFAGYLKDTALHEVIHQSRAVVLPSEWYENAPMSVLESYALSRPVIGADIGGIPELIKPGVTGEIFESGNVEALAAVLTDFSCRTDDDVLAMGMAGRSWMKDEFSAQRYLERMLNLYAGLLV